jgi:hypothetical protein
MIKTRPVRVKCAAPVILDNDTNWSAIFKEVRERIKDNRGEFVCVSISEVTREFGCYSNQAARMRAYINALIRVSGSKGSDNFGTLNGWVTAQTGKTISDSSARALRVAWLDHLILQFKRKGL